MNDQPRFDESRSAAIRSMLVSTVADAPRRDHKRHLRIAVISVIAALAAGIGSAGVAVALTGTDLFGAPAPAPAVTETVTAAPPPVQTPKPTAPAPTATPHPLVVTGDPITPHDVLTQPSTTPKWSLTLPGVGDMCEYPSVVDVSDGYALVQTGPTRPPEDSAYDCNLDESRYSLTLIDTSTGTAIWSRDWTWAFDYNAQTTATLLGTSGRVMVRDLYTSSDPAAGPSEVLDVATGATLGDISTPAGLEIDRLDPVPGVSGDVSFVARQLDPAGQPTTNWVVMRSDPRDLGSPLWSVPLQGERVTAAAIENDSSILQVTRTVDSRRSALDVFDVDTGAVMVADTTDRRYFYYDGFTVRGSDMLDGDIFRSVAGIDEAGNEIWNRTLDSGYRIAPVNRIGADPNSSFPLVSDVLLVGPGTQLELIDGRTGATRWKADGSACATTSTTSGTFVSTSSFFATSDGLVVSYDDDTGRCGFDQATGSSVDVSQRVSPWKGARGLQISYQLTGGMGTGGLWSFKGQKPVPVGSAPKGAGTAVDAATGAPLWSIPIAYDEHWDFAGGYLVGFSNGTVFGIG